jgi:hypothetical protein
MKLGNRKYSMPSSSSASVTVEWSRPVRLASDARTRSARAWRAVAPGAIATSASFEPSMARTISTSSSRRPRCSLLTPTAVIMRLTWGP